MPNPLQADADLLFAQKRRIVILKKKMLDFKKDPRAMKELIELIEELMDSMLND